MNAHRTFTPSDQQAFAELSGDHNPLHLDELGARRFLFGGTVVHGIHQLLWSLDDALRGPSHIVALKASFRKPALVGDRISSTAHLENSVLKIRQAAAGEDIAVFSATLTPLQSKSEVTHEAPAHGAPADTGPRCQVGVTGSIALTVDPRKFRNLFRRLPELLSEHQVAFLLATTRLVGMECPGLHSIYSELDARFSEGPAAKPATLDWRVDAYDARFSKVTIAASASFGTAKIAAFVRPQPPQPPSYQQAKNACSADAFRGRRALVIGGSRGLGEVVAKLLAAGGADVRLTYHRGESDARSVVEEITAGGGKAASFHLDVTNPDRGLAALADAWQPTHLYYFATPPIFRGGFIQSEALLERFRQYYVIAFATVVAAAKARTAGRLSVFYPSSTAIDEKPRAMNEYIAAKLEGEELCRTLAQDGGVDIHVERLPRLKTDQTATVMPIAAGDPLPLMAGILGKC
jgi:hypothetical protein